MKKVRKKLSIFASWVAEISGSPMTLGLGLVLILFWAVLGPIMNFSESWQLIINTSTTIITFIIALSIQYTQNRDNKSLQNKLRQIEKELDEDD